MALSASRLQPIFALRMPHAKRHAEARTQTALWPGAALKAEGATLEKPRSLAFIHGFILPFRMIVSPNKNPNMSIKILSLLLTATVATAFAGSINPLPEKVPCAIVDRQDSQIPDRVRFTGWVGSRIEVNEANRLAKLDPARLLEGYRKRPGRQSWDGEHVGKWLHAATLAWVYTGDPALRAKLDDTAAELCKCQLADGYLGTYLEKDRWTEWDVWAHKYNLIGLITYMRYTGNLQPLPTCRRMADLVVPRPSAMSLESSDIIEAGQHVGMASTSVLEPMVLLYRLTGETRYLDFCKYILRAWEQPNGPHIISTPVDPKAGGQGRQWQSLRNALLPEWRAGIPPHHRRSANSRSLPQCLAGHRGQAPLHHRGVELRRAVPR